MNKSDVKELHYISPLDNVRSILSLGILSRNGANLIPHTSVADEKVQEYRSEVVLPTNVPLHDHVNLYFHARNPMMSKLRNRHADLCVLRISPAVLDLPGVYVAPRNAATKDPVFYEAPSGLQFVDEARVFSRSWWHDDEDEKKKRGAIKCAEVLVPNRVPASYIFGTYVSCHSAEIRFRQISPSLSVKVLPDMFFSVVGSNEG